MTCARCEEMKERVAWLESELGMISDESKTSALAKRLGLRPGAVKTLLALYNAKGKMVSKFRLLEVTADLAVDDNRDMQIVSVLICYCRRALGDDAIETDWGKGYRITPAGTAIIDAALKATA